MKTLSPLLRGKILVAVALMALAWGASAKEFLVYFGTFTNASCKGVYVSRLDTATGKLSAPELAAETPSPSFLAISPDEKILYAANNYLGFNGENAGAVSSFTIDKNSGHLTLLNQKSSTGPGPCHVSVDAAANVLLIANYAGGSVKSFQLNRDGTIGADGSFILHHGSGVNPSRQASAHAHSIYSDSSGRFALVCDLGTDKVVVYKVNPETGTLTENSVATVPPGSGPRHLAFSPDGKFVHVVNEMGCTITTFAWDSNAGKLKLVETVSALPPPENPEPVFTANEIVAFTAAEILTFGNHVYATIRGHDSVSVFAADAQSGRLTFLQNVPSGGKFPRGLGIDPTGHWLFVGNQKTDNAVEFAIDPNSGKISATGRELKIGSPVDVKFVKTD